MGFFQFDVKVFSLNFVRHFGLGRWGVQVYITSLLVIIRKGWVGKSESRTLRLLRNHTFARIVGSFQERKRRQKYTDELNRHKGIAMDDVRIVEATTLHEEATMTGSVYYKGVRVTIWRMWE